MLFYIGLLSSMYYVYAINNNVHLRKTKKTDINYKILKIIGIFLLIIVKLK